MSEKSNKTNLCKIIIHILHLLHIIATPLKPNPRHFPKPVRAQIHSISIRRRGNNLHWGILPELFPIRSQSLIQLIASIFDRHPIQITSARRSSRRRIRSLIRRRVLREDRIHRNAELLRRNLYHLRVETLAHLRAGVIKQYTAIRIDLHARSSLVEMQGGGETETEFRGHERDAAFAVLVFAVEGLYCGFPRFVVSFFFYLGEEEGNVPVGVDGLQEGGSIAFFVEVEETEVVDGNPEAVGYRCHVCFGEEHGLGAAEAAERGVGMGVGFADMAAEEHVWDFVAVVEMGETAAHYSC
jgi:hypothetical protein